MEAFMYALYHRVGIMLVDKVLMRSIYYLSLDPDLRKPLRTPIANH